MKITTDEEKSITKTPFIKMMDGSSYTMTREQGGRTIAEDANGQFFGLIQVLHTMYLEKLAFKGRHG